MEQTWVICLFLAFIVSSGMSSAADTDSELVIAASSENVVPPVSILSNDPVSSPYRDPVSSPYRDQASSPVDEDVSSPLNERESSPLNERESSPLNERESSPRLDSPQTSPKRSSSDDECVPRKRYKLDGGPKVPFNPLYWPATTSQDHSFPETQELSASEGLPQSSVELRISACTPDHISTDSDGDELPIIGGVDTYSSDSSGVSDETSSSAASSSSSSSSPSDSSSEDSEDSDSDSNSNSSNSEDEGPLQESIKVFQQSKLSVDEGVLSLMNLFLKHKLEKGVMGDILNVVLQFLPKDNKMPKSQYLLFKYVKSMCPLGPESFHFYCKKCHFYLGKVEGKCNVCQSDESNKFIQLSLACQIKSLFECHNLADVIDKYNAEQRDRPIAGKYNDICDGSEFKRAWCGGQYDLVLHGYTDGVDLSDSSDVKFWPLNCIICQIPPKIRFRYVLTCGIWIDNSKPLMNTYLVPYAEELKDLYKNGVKWTHPESKTEYVTRVSAPGFCGDAPVRADVQNILQHGGRHCCNNCEQKMALCTCANGERKRVFHLLEQTPHLRTASRMRTQGEKTRLLRENQRAKKVVPCKGVKGHSILSRIPTCDRSTAVYPEYMHILLGIIKQFMRLWFKTNDKDRWSLRAHEDDINSLLVSIRVPDFLRVCRSAEFFTKWKANECRAFLLFYSLIVLAPYMKEKYFQHWLLLVCATYLLLQDSVSELDIERADILLRLFLRDFSELYRAQDFTYNLHNLNHLGLTVRRWGPLWANSAFMFESLNGKLTECIHGTKNQGMELTNTLILFKGIQVLKARVEAKNICSETLVGNEIELRNKIKKKTLNAVIMRRASVDLSGLVPFYRAVINGEVYTSVHYSRQVQRNNYTVCYLNSKGVKAYGEIICFCEGPNDEKVSFVNAFQVEHLRTFQHLETRTVVKHIIPVALTDIVDSIPAKNIMFKVIRAGSYICLRPNIVEANL